MIRFGLIGYPLSHSFSEGYFSAKFEREQTTDQFRYDTFPLESINKFPQLLLDYPALRGINVTIPYKEQVIPFLDELSPAAKAIGAVNTILNEKGRLKGFNTDVIGFKDSLDTFLQQNGGAAKAALILGTGGAAKAIAWVLAQSGVQYHYVSRKKSPNYLNYEKLDANLMAQIDLIVNTTPLGMFPNVETCPNIPYHCLSDQHRLYDLVYNPEKPLFLAKGEAAGAAICNGLAMLHGQADAAWDIWTVSMK
ncbi:MAG: shikimate dehydrogenase [Bacteroidota bacterium]